MRESYLEAHVVWHVYAVPVLVVDGSVVPALPVQGVVRHVVVEVHVDCVAHSAGAGVLAGASVVLHAAWQVGQVVEHDVHRVCDVHARGGVGIDFQPYPVASNWVQARAQLATVAVVRAGRAVVVEVDVERHPAALHGGEVGGLVKASLQHRGCRALWCRDVDHDVLASGNQDLVDVHLVPCVVYPSVACSTGVVGIAVCVDGGAAVHPRVLLGHRPERVGGVDSYSAVVLVGPWCVVSGQHDHVQVVVTAAPVRHHAYEDVLPAISEVDVDDLWVVVVRVAA